MKNMKKRILSLMLVLCMVFTMVPNSAFATEGTAPIGTSRVADSGEPAVCQHTHDDTCGYTEGSPAVDGGDCTYTHEHNETCGYTVGTSETPCDKACKGEHAEDCAFAEEVAGTDCTDSHTHDENCGFVEGSAEVAGTPCTHECELCKPTEQPKADCTCETKCTLADKVNGDEADREDPLGGEENAVEESSNPDCPVCGVDNADFSLCLGAAAMLMTTPRTAPAEQFNLATGQTYYFDLSGELGTVTNGKSDKIGTINKGGTEIDPYPGLLDTTLHYVPFTYAGTVNAYSLDSTSTGNTGASAAATASDRSLFVADYTISHTVSWDMLNTNNLIFGKTFDTNYKLRSLSAGSSNDSSGGSPTTNEWDSILTKSGSIDNATGWIKNWISIYSWGQDTYNSSGTYRGLRGYSSATTWAYIGAFAKGTNFGWRPALEVSDSLSANALKAVTLDLNGGSFDTNGSIAEGVVGTINIVCAGNTFKAPSGEGLTAPSGKVFDKWQKTGDANTTYEVDTSITYEAGLGLTALWESATTPEATPNATFTATGHDSGTLTSVTDGMKYSTDGGSNWTDITTTTATIASGITTANGIQVVKKGNGTTTSDSDAQTITVTHATIPIGIDKTDETSALNDGTITGVTTAMEYKLSTVSVWTDCGGTTVTGLANGTYDVRVKASGSVLASANASVTIAAFAKGTPTKDNLHFDLTAVNYDSNAKAVSVTAKEGKNLGAITVKYAGSTTAPTNAGTYSVTADIASSADYNAVTGLSLGNFTINKATNDITNLTIDNWVYGGTPSTPTATATFGTPTFTYSDSENGTYTTTVPTNAGNHWVKAEVTETANYAQATASYTVAVAKKDLTLKADDKSMTKGGALPTFTYTATGLVNGDTVTTAPNIATTTNGNTTGTFDIIISDGVVANVANYTITYTKGTLTVSDAPITTYTIAATAVTGGTITPSGSVAVNNGESKTFTITPNSNYFIADVLVDGVSQGKITSYTFSNVTANHTISATFNYNGGGGGSSSGGSSSSDDSDITVTPPPADKPNTPTEGNIKVTGKVDSNGNASVSITDKNINDAYNKALADAKKNGNEANGIILVLNINTGNKTANSLTVNLPKIVQENIINKKIVNTIVVVDNPDIKINMDLSTIKEINKQAKADVTITAIKQDNSKLTGSSKSAIGSRPVFDLKVNYGSGKQISNFGAGSVAVEIPYTLGAGEKVGNIYAVYVDANGKVHWLTNSVYDSVEKVLRFSTNHFSTYGIGYKQTNTAFTDIAAHWAKEDIEFVVSRGLFSGTSNTTFSPNTAMTRGMFVTALGRLANANVSDYAKSSFTDVKNDAYYMGYIEWASKNNIVNGIGNNKFAPDQSITREQMAVIMSNYAKIIGYTLPKVHAENIFVDNAKINAYAKEAVKQVQMAGMISGKNGNLFDPQGTATRAEVSAVLRRFP